MVCKSLVTFFQYLFKNAIVPDTMYILKQIPEDFIVKEISNVEIKTSGRYLYLKLTKKNWNTLDAIKKIADALHLKEKQIGFAGSKDKLAITEQVISISGSSKERIQSLAIPNASLQFLGYGDTPISLGDLEGNQFEITIRNLEPRTKIDPITFIENYFDEQRFSSHNTAIGKALIQKDFATALQLIDNPYANIHLQASPQDYISALKKLPLRLLRLYINSYQSYLWNETLAEYSRQHCSGLHEVPYSQGKLIFSDDPTQLQKVELPIIGFGYQETIAPDIIADILKKENLAPQDFIIRQIPELTLEGELREAIVEVKEMKISPPQPDELNPKKNKVLISFILPKGSYATMVIKKVMSYL